eukprot:463134_1
MSIIKAENDPSDVRFEKSESHHARESHCSQVPPQPSTKAFKCKYCQKEFCLKEHLIRHASEAHSVLVGLIKQEEQTCQSNICEICQKVFESSESLEYHLRIHCDDRQFACEVCQKSFKLNSDLNSHLKRHSNENPYTCDICQKNLKSKYLLKGHLRIHCDDTPFACEVCQKAFKWNSNLKSHMKTHSDEKLYVCEICHKEFKRKQGLKTHCLRIHCDDKPFGCE